MRMSSDHPSPQIFSFVAAHRASYPDTIGSYPSQEIEAMSSHTRNTHRPNRDRRSRILGTALALALASGAALAQGSHRFVFTAYTDVAGGAEVLAGRYHAALEELSGDAGSMALDPSAVDTNRCIAYSMTLQWQKGHAACDAAVRAASKERNLPSVWWRQSRGSDDDYLALAYANRAVLDWMSSDEAAARKDLAEAREIAPRSGFVAQNLAALEAHSKVAQAKAQSEVARAGAPVPAS
jgi:hypothetical protein